jgi:hypothetical protein
MQIQSRLDSIETQLFIRCLRKDVYKASVCRYFVEVVLDGKTDGIAVFMKKSSSSKLMHQHSTSSKINHSLTIEWE